MKIIATLLVTGLALATGYAQETKFGPAPSELAPVLSRLSVAQVKEIAAARVRDTGYAVKASDPWSVTLQIQPKGNVWVAILTLPTGQPSPFHIFVDDATGRSEYIAPIVKLEQRFVDDADWLIKVEIALKRVKYPIELETLMRVAHFTGAMFSMGGGTKTGRAFLDYTLRQESEGPARFDVRCFVEEPDGPAGPKMVTAAEICYIDAKTYRYRLVLDSN